MRTFVLLASIVLTAASFDASTQPGKLTDLVVEDATIDISTPDPIAVRVRNQGQRTIVAFGVRTTTTDANGVVVHSGGGTDGFEYDVRVLHGSPVLRPNDTYTIRLQQTRRGYEPVSVAATPSWAIFDDNSAAGDERSIEMQFEFRARQAVGWQFVERALAEATQSGMVADDVLQFVNAKPAAAPKEIKDSSAGWQVPQRISIALRSPETARSLVDELNVEAGVRAKAAAARAIRRR